MTIKYSSRHNESRFVTKAKNAFHTACSDELSVVTGVSDVEFPREYT